MSLRPPERLRVGQMAAEARAERLRGHLVTEVNGIYARTRCGTVLWAYVGERGRVERSVVVTDVEQMCGNCRALVAPRGAGDQLYGHELAARLMAAPNLPLVFDDGAAAVAQMYVLEDMITLCRGTQG